MRTQPGIRLAVLSPVVWFVLGLPFSAFMMSVGVPLVGQLPIPVFQLLGIAAFVTGRRALLSGPTAA